MRDNSQLYCTVNFTYSEPMTPLFRKVFEKQFMRLRDEAIDLVNPCYEQWNKEYDKEVKGEDDLEYNSYIASKHREMFKPLNEKHKNDIAPLRMRLDSDDENADIIGVINWAGRDIIMHMTIKIINEKEWREYHKTH